MSTITILRQVVNLTYNDPDLKKVLTVLRPDGLDPLVKEYQRVSQEDVEGVCSLSLEIAILSVVEDLINRGGVSDRAAAELAYYGGFPIVSEPENE